jgi:signal transduction histidine kinase/DNA-binding NarL/FixJ family response regulator
MLEQAFRAGYGVDPTMTRIGGQVGNDVAARAAGLIAIAEELAGEFSLRPLLEQILRRCTELLGCDAGSICSVDEAAGVYRKEADIGVACNSGAVYPLTEGMTGAVVARRAPLWFARYEDVPGGHVAAESRATLRGVIGVPLEWRGRIIGVCIVFSRDDRRTFGRADAELLRLFARHAAIALANARMHEEAEKLARSEAVAAERDRMLAELHDTLAQRLVGLRVHVDHAGQQLAATADGAADGTAAEELRRASAIAAEALVEVRLTLLGLAASPLDGRTLEAALRSEVAWAQSTGHLEVRFVSAGTPVPLAGDLSREVLRTAREALTNIVAHARARTARLGLLYEAEAVSLLVQDDGQGFDPRSGWQRDHIGLRAMADRASALGATVDVDSLPGWGTRIRARFPYTRDPEPAQARPRVLVAARQPALRAGLARLLAWTEPGLEIIGEAATAEDAIEACRTLRPEVALADLGLGVAPIPDEPGERPDGDGITGQLIAAHQGLAVVGICDSASEQADDQVARAMRAGARGCVDTEADGPELARAVVAAARGQAILSGPMLRQLRRGLRADEELQPLTGREREVRGLMEQGLPDKIIAERLMLSVKTIEKHAGAVLRKTGARNRTELAARVTRPAQPAR